MTQNIGALGEQAVVDYLKKEKFSIIKQNFRQFFGEIDIIAQKNDIVAFIEVKARKDCKVSLFELISQSKKQKIIKTAKKYIAIHHATQKNITFRFDVALVHYQNNNIPTISYIPNAFSLH